LTLKYEPPVEGCTLHPFILLKCKNGGTMVADESSDVLYRWYRSAQRLCSSENCGKPAKLQCLSCCKLDVTSKETYFCSRECMKNSWHTHQKLHGKFMLAAAQVAKKEATQFFDLDKWQDDDVTMKFLFYFLFLGGGNEGNQELKVLPAEEAKGSHRKFRQIVLQVPTTD
ncbi:hypothetical protein RFI_16932, partial [Reticulomyxa filosa]